MKRYQKIKGKITHRIKVNNANMIGWLILPVLTLFIATNYFFQKPSDEKVLGISANPTPTSNNNIDSKKDIKQKFSEYKWNGQGVVSIIFTGAYKNQHDKAYPEMNKRGLSASLSVPTNDVNLSGSMSWTDIRFLQFKGWEIISQSKNQICEKEKLESASTVDDEVIDSKRILSELGLEANLYLSPCGIVTPEVTKTVNQNYNGFVKFGIETNKPSHTNTENLISRQIDNTVNKKDVEKWIKSAKTNKDWLILSFPDIGEAENINNVSLDLLEETLDLILESKMEVVIPGQILKYDK